MPWYCAVQILNGEHVYCGIDREKIECSDEVYVAEAANEPEAVLAAEMGAAYIQQSWEDR